MIKINVSVPTISTASGASTVGNENEQEWSPLNPTAGRASN